MSNFTQSQIDAVWNKATVIKKDSKWRKDVCGAWIHQDSYGKTSDGGWEIDHVYPKSKGGDDTPVNLRPMHWKNNRSKDDDYPTYNAAVTAEGTKNIEKEVSWTVNSDLQEKLSALYKIKVG